MQWAQTCAADSLKVVIPPFEKTVEGHVIYFYKVLELALHKTEASDGPFEISFAPEFVSVERGLADLKNGASINVMWTTINPKRAQDLLPVRISLLRELNNYRVFFIRTGEQERFDHIKSLSDLRKFTAGLGSQWPDTEVMRNNALNVVTSPAYLPLFKMLAAKRFDYFPRGIYEVWNEEKIHADLGISVEKNIMLYYNSPFYFFVNKKNPALANRIERGLKLAIADGSFDELLLSVPNFKRATEEQLNSRRRLIILESRYNSYQK
jgi:hypothetical protein